MRIEGYTVEGTVNRQKLERTFASFYRRVLLSLPVFKWRQRRWIFSRSFDSCDWLYTTGV